MYASWHAFSANNPGRSARTSGFMHCVAHAVKHILIAAFGPVALVFLPDSLTVHIVVVPSQFCDGSFSLLLKNTIFFNLSMLILLT